MVAPLAPAIPHHGGPSTLASPNYSFQKRQRELAKKKKKEEKLSRKAEKSGPNDGAEGADGQGEEHEDAANPGGEQL